MKYDECKKWEWNLIKTLLRRNSVSKYFGWVKRKMWDREKRSLMLRDKLATTSFTVLKLKARNMTENDSNRI